MERASTESHTPEGDRASRLRESLEARRTSAEQAGPPERDGADVPASDAQEQVRDEPPADDQLAGLRRIAGAKRLDLDEIVSELLGDVDPQGLDDEQTEQVAQEVRGREAVRQ
jgi:hypothetical protein